MSKSVEILKQFLEEEYIHNEEMNSPDMSSAIRDILTDLMHLSLAKDVGVDIGVRFQDAIEVWQEEVKA